MLSSSSHEPQTADVLGQGEWSWTVYEPLSPCSPYTSNACMQPLHLLIPSSLLLLCVTGRGIDLTQN